MTRVWRRILFLPSLCFLDLTAVTSDGVSVTTLRPEGEDLMDPILTPDSGSGIKLGVSSSNVVACVLDLSVIERK